MDNSEKIEAFYAKEHRFKNGLAVLRELALTTSMQETYKWSAPIYTIDNKNVLGIMAFKSHFGLWFFNGVFLSDPKNVLENAQSGKTKAMRHWKFTSGKDIDKIGVLAYMNEAIHNQKKGIVLPPAKNKSVKTSPVLAAALSENIQLKDAYYNLAPFKQREYSEYLLDAKLDKTKKSRLEKIIPLIIEGKGLNDKYR